MSTFEDSRPYLYTNLIHTDSIRLLCLQPNHSSDAPLRGELIEARLNDNLEFEALSYAWGEDQGQSRAILLDGAHFPISGTLFSALRVFRRSDEPRKLWIDAICINQQDIKERSCQVAQMSTIYKSAAEILIWLGESTDSTEEALQFLRDVGASNHQMDLSHGSQGPSWFRFGNRIFKGSREDAMRIVQGTLNSNLDDIFGRPWFTRLWIIQEIALAKSATLYCGNHTMEWADFAISLSVLAAAMNTTEFQIAQMTTFLTAWRVVDVKASFQVTIHAFYMSPYNELSDFMKMIKNQKCKDDRDRIYSLLGLGLFHLKQVVTRGGISSAIVPDYSKSTSEVYTNVAKHYLLQADLFILHDAGLWRRLPAVTGCHIQEYQPETPPGSSEYLSSWVPEFQNSRSFDKIPWYDDSFKAGLSMSLMQVTIEPNTPFRIHLKGKFIDKVTRRISALGLENATNRFQAVCNLAENCISAFFEEVYSGLGIISQFDLPLTLVGNGAVDGLKKHMDTEGRVRFADVWEMWQLFQKHCLQADGEIKKKIIERARESSSFPAYDILGELSDDGKKALMFYNALCDVFEQFQFMITSDGRIGLMPLLAELTDTIFLFPGLPTPYILRRVVDSDDFVVIGPCYVHGIMDGEAMRSTFHWDSVALI